MLGNSDPASEIIARYDHALTMRGTLDAHCEEIARRVWPNYTGSFQNRGITRLEGEKRTEDMVDASAALALPKFGAVMESMLTPRGSIWQRVVPTDKILMRNRMVRMWCDDVTDILFAQRQRPIANFQGQQQLCYQALGAFGTGCKFIDKLQIPGQPEVKGLRYKAIHLGEIVFLENHQGIIDTAFRKFDLSARQAAQKFGVDNLPGKIAEAIKEGGVKGEQKFWFIHCVKPRADYDPERKDVKGMLFTDEYVSVEERVIVRAGGYFSFPYSISRYTQAPGEVYGRSPAMMALPAIKVLNEQKKTVLKQGHRTVDPVLLMHDDGVLDTFSLKPGSMNSGGVTADGKPLVHALPVGNLAIAHDMMQAEGHVIQDAFLLTLFQILVDTPQMTATEALERAREKGVLLSPTMGRQETEDLGPLTERELDVLAQQGLLPPMPQILKDAQGEVSFEYDNPMSRMQKAEATAGTMRTLGYAAEIFKMTADPSVMDSFDFDEIVPALADANAMPTKQLASPEKIAAKRESRQKEQAAQRAIDAAPAMASMMKGTQPPV